MTEITLRPANRREASAIRALVIAAGLNPFGLDWRRFVVAISPAGQVVGCLQHKPHRDGSLELASLVTAPDFREQGIARRLIADFLEQHEPPVYLMCRAELTEFYVRFGFQVVPLAEMPPYFRRIQRLTDLFLHGRDAKKGLRIMCRGCSSA
jgi:amino-acid N-acetyltransferase